MWIYGERAKPCQCCANLVAAIWSSLLLFDFIIFHIAANLLPRIYSSCIYHSRFGTPSLCLSYHIRNFQSGILLFLDGLSAADISLMVIPSLFYYHIRIQWLASYVSLLRFACRFFFRCVNYDKTRRVTFFIIFPIMKILYLFNLTRVT